MKFDVFVFIELRRFRKSARSVGPGLGARLHPTPVGDVAPTNFSFGRFLGVMRRVMRRWAADTAASMRFDLECPLCASCKPAQLEVGIIMDYLLHETYVK